MGDNSLHGRILITARFYPEYHYGDNLEIECKLKKPEPFEGFEYDKYLSRYDIYSLCAFPIITLLEENKGSAVRAALLDFKKHFTSRLEKNFAGDTRRLSRRTFDRRKKQYSGGIERSIFHNRLIAHFGSIRF